MAVVKGGIKITYRGIRSGMVGVRKMRSIVRDALKAAIAEWWKNFLPQRFQPGARGKFDFAPRRPSYDAFKKRVQGRQVAHWAGRPITPFWVARNQPRDIVLSGETMRMTSQYLSVTGTYRKARGTIKVPAHFSIGSSGTGRVAELLSVTQSEARTLAKLVDRKVQEGINADRSVETVTVTA